MQHDGSTTAKWWMICRSGAGRPAAMTLPCGGGRALALFGHEEEAELFLWSLALDGLENGWRIRKGQHAEIVSMLYGPHARAGRGALDPLPTMASEGTVSLVSLDRFAFVMDLLAHDGARTPPGHRQCGSAPDRQRTYGRRLCALCHPDRAGRGPEGSLGTRTEPE
jgi:hypothetical protein